MNTVARTARGSQAPQRGVASAVVAPGVAPGVSSRSAAVGVDRPSAAAGTPRFARLAVAGSEGALEHESRRAAGSPAVAAAAGASAARPSRSTPSPLAQALTSSGQPLGADTRQAMESRLGAEFSQVRLHTGAAPAALARQLGARAFTHRHDVFFGAGYGPGDDDLTAHELSHVVQQSGGGGGFSAAPDAVQCDRNGSFIVNNGGFEIDLQTRTGALGTPPGAVPAAASGMDGYIRFVPGVEAPLSNQIEMVQIARVTQAADVTQDFPVGTLPNDRNQRGALGTPGLLTDENAATGVQGGFFTDVQHAAGGPAGAPAVPRQGLSTAFTFEPARAGEVGSVGTVRQPAFYGSGVGGVFRTTPGFKRSDDLADIRSAALYDTPGIASNTVNIDFEFESVAMAQDKGLDLAAVFWGFGVHAGAVVNEHLTVGNGASATFDEAMERHRDFYVHEPVSFYFDFDDDVLPGTEAARIDDFMPYLLRAGNADVTLALEGFADLVGGPSAYNRGLARRRAQAVRSEIVARGLPAGRITGITATGASTAATGDAGTGDQGGSAALGADQTREANRWANRRVVVTFSRPAAPPAAAPAGP